MAAHRRRLVLLFTSLVAALTAPAAPAATDAPRQLVSVLSATGFGRVVTAPSGQAIYTWTPEQRDRRVHCTRTCAVVWPPVVVPRGRVVPARIAGIRGRFGTIRRPDGRRQLTLDRVPLYTYAHERPRQVLCDDVDGWFVVRARR